MPDLALDLPAFDRRLSPSASAPIAVAYSGGGDSLAALIATQLWAQRRGRPVLALHVDHGLQPASGDWARLAAQTAARLGVAFRGLAWVGDKPRHGLPAGARSARHRLIAEAAREAGASTVVFGHTADDELEAALMRGQGSNLGRLAEWRPSPAWPEGRGLFLLRPLLGLRRAEIRRRLDPFGLAWIEDPANGDLRSLRARARARLAEAGEIEPADVAIADPELAELARSARIDAAGAICLERARLLAAAPLVARRFLSAALVCVSGGARPPRQAALQALLTRLAESAPVVATLAGARLSADRNILIARESGSYRRHGAPEARLAAGAVAIWDGRFELSAVDGAVWAVRPLAGIAAKLNEKQKLSLHQWPREVRGSLPAVVDEHGHVTCPILAGAGAVTAKSLVSDRLNGACGVISREPTT